jgi:uncharacterized protein YpmS
MEVKKNVWKIAFLSLLCSLAVLFMSLLIWFYFFFSTPDYVQHEREHRSGETMFVISTTKDRLNSFLAEQISTDGNNNFQITLSEDVLLEAAIPLFGRNIAFELFLQPEVYGDGDLLLKSKSFHIGGIQLPSQTLFSLIKNTLSFPEWIEINTNEETIILKVTDIDGLESMYIKVTKFDLEMDNIEFELVSLKK